ncbi:MAG TPA: hypothetical protein VME46_10520, partial [Acidimicrobiales bacterium]|nr:hypothetical protein [Acidimicrobiales bacterium]
TLAATDPIVSIMIGVIAFNEVLRSGAATTLLEVVSFGVMVAGIFMLAHTEAVNSAHDKVVATAREA